jgi:hypothetical protein
MANIDVERVPGDATTDVFRVTVTDAGTSTEHRVTVAAPPPAVADGYPSLEAFVCACFAFLLAREPKESILSSFEVREIGRYFPGWERELVVAD